VKTQTFGIRGIEWQLISTEDGTKKAVAMCPDHPNQEARVLEAVADHVLVWCSQCGQVLEMCSKGELASERERILAIFHHEKNQKPAER